MVQNIRDLKNERGLTSYDSKFINTTSLVYRLPFGRGRRFGAAWSPVIDAFGGGWEVNTIHTAYSGRPVNIIYTPSAALDVTGRLAERRGGAQQRPNVVGD